VNVITVKFWYRPTVSPHLFDQEVTLLLYNPLQSKTNEFCTFNRVSNRKIDAKYVQAWAKIGLIFRQ